MNFTYKSQGNNTYLVYEIEDESVLDTMSLGMLKNNKVDGIMPIIYTQMDDKKYIQYNVSAKLSAKQFFSGSVNKKRMLGLLEGIAEAFISAEDYMIDTNTLLLDMEYIFVDVSTCKASLICFPVYGLANAQPDLTQFFRNLVFGTQYDQTENCDYVAQIINFLNRSPMIVMTEFKALLDQLNGSPAAPAQRVQSAPTPQPIQQPAPQSVKPATSSALNVISPLDQSTMVNGIPVSSKNAPQSGMPVNPFSSGSTNVGGPIPGSLPNAPTGAPQGVPGGQKAATGEKKMGLMNLLAHYNKENAEIYKAQQAAKKAAAAQSKPAKKEKAPKQASAPATPGMPGFAIPGQQVSINGMASTPASAPTPTAANPRTTDSNGFPMLPTVEKPKANPSSSTPYPAPTPMAMPTQPSQQPIQKPLMPQGAAMDFGDTVVLSGNVDDIGATVVLGTATQANVKKEPYLIRTRNKERIPINKDLFRIGKEPTYADYYIGDNSAISRSHANIISRGGEYYVMDTNSTNHTYVNDIIVPKNMETKISHGDKVRLANEEFEFRFF